MIDFRPVVYVMGVLVMVLGASTIAPMALDFVLGDGNADAFLIASAASVLIGAFTAIACRSSITGTMTIRQAFLMTFLILVVPPFFSALPLLIGEPGASFTDAYFEAVSGITTTGSTVFVGLDHFPAGTNHWRGILNWFGGIGFAFLTMIFLPHLRVGGMQFFKTQGFDTLGKTLPRAVDIARGLLAIYAGLTIAAVLTFLWLGMSGLDAVVNGMASIAPGGFSPADASFGKYKGTAEYAGALFMILGSLPCIRFMQLAYGNARPLLGDLQVRAYLLWIAPVHYDGRTVDDDALGAIILHLTSYLFLIGLLSVVLSLDGVDMQSAFFAIWTLIGNIGFGFGEMVARTGTFVDFSTFSKWVLIVTMIMGRLGLLAALILILPRFWRAGALRRLTSRPTQSHSISHD